MFVRGHLRTELADERGRGRQHGREQGVVRRIDGLRLTGHADEATQAARDAHRLLTRHPTELLGEQLGARRIEARAEQAPARFLQEEGDECPVAQEVAAEVLVDGRGDLIDLMAECLERETGLTHGIAHTWIHGHPTHRIHEDTDAQTSILGAHHHSDGRERLRAIHPLGLSQVVGGIAHRPRDDALRDEVDRQPIEFRCIDDPPSRRLEADQPARSRRNADRSATVIGVGDRHDAGRDESRRATA